MKLIAQKIHNNTGSWELVFDHDEQSRELTVNDIAKLAGVPCTTKVSEAISVEIIRQTRLSNDRNFKVDEDGRYLPISLVRVGRGTQWYNTSNFQTQSKRALQLQAVQVIEAITAITQAAKNAWVNDEDRITEEWVEVVFPMHINLRK